jgi:hypothetical protein
LEEAQAAADEKVKNATTASLMAKNNVLKAEGNMSLHKVAEEK